MEGGMPQKLSAWRSNSVLWGIVWFFTYFGVRAVAETPERYSSAAIVAIVLIPVIPAALFLFFFIAEIRQADELHRRIQLEALAFAYPLVLLLLMTLGLLQLVIDLNPDDWSYRHVWQFVIVFYLAGLALATRRYQ
jgi:hypothetical protein